MQNHSKKLKFFHTLGQKTPTQGRVFINKFLTYLNAEHPSIKFTADFCGSEINFLDVKISRHKGDKLPRD